MHYISRILFVLSILTATYFMTSAHADNTADHALQIHQSNPLSAVMLEYATHICEAEMVQGFLRKITSDDPFIISLRSKTLLNGLELVRITFENKHSALVIERPVQNLKPHNTLQPNCLFWIKDLALPKEN